MASNGYLSFGEVYNDFSDEPFPTGSTEFRYLIAPMWNDLDVTDGGSISYEVHEYGSGITLSNHLLYQVSSYISETRHVDFYGSWMVVAHWEDVPRFYNILRRVSFCLCFASTSIE